MQKVHYRRWLLLHTLVSPKTAAFIGFIFFLNFSIVCSAAVINVPANYLTIQEAIDAASDGDEIIVSPETYSETINFNGKNIILRSTDPTSPTIVESTIINGEYFDGSVVTFFGTELTTCVLSGFTIGWGSGSAIYGNGTLATIQYNDIKYSNANWLTPNRYGGGLYQCNGTIQNNIIHDNYAFFYGGGLAKCNGTIQNNTIFNNRALEGAGLYSCHGTIQNNIISDNRAENWGGGLNDCDGIIKNNTISGNYTRGTSGYGREGGGLAYCDGTIDNNTISNNRALDGGGLHKCHGTIQNNTISSNSAYFYGGGLYDCRGTIQNNTIFANTAAANGGGLYSRYSTITNNIITGNSAPYGGGLTVGYDTRVWNCTVSGNKGGGLFYYVPTPTPSPTPPWMARGCNEESVQDESTQTINKIDVFEKDRLQSGNHVYAGYWYVPGVENCIFWNNHEFIQTGDIYYNYLEPDLNYCCLKGGWSEGIGNIDADPIFVDPGKWTGSPGESDWIQGDYHLQGSSPCIDAGGEIALSEDFEGDPRPCDSTAELRGDGSDFDIGADEFIGPISYDFTSSQEGWTTDSARVAFSVPQYSSGRGCVTIVCQNNTDTFGFWVSPENAIPVTKGNLYRARFVVSTDVTEPWLVPQMRLRVNARNFQQADYLTIESNGDGGASPTPGGTIYDLYFVPPTNTGYCMLAFDLLNFDPYDAENAELALESVLVERFRLDTLDESTTITWAYDFERGLEFWSPSEGTTVFTDPGFFWADGALHLKSTTNTDTFGYWGSDPADIKIEEGRLYRGTFEVRADEPDRSLVPQMRLRFNTTNFQASRSFEIISSGDGANSPGITNSIYDRLYFLPPANCVGEGLIVSFDILNFLPYEAVADATLILDHAIIETLSPPTSP